MATSHLEHITLNAASERYTYTGRFRLTLDAAEGPLRALELGRTLGPDPVPQRFAPYFSSLGSTPETDLGSFAQDFDVTRVRDDQQANHLYDVSVTWRPLEPGQSTQDSIPNPVERPTRLRVEFQDTQELLRAAYNIDAIPNRTAGTLGPIENAARQKYHEQIFRDDRMVILVATKNFATQEEIADLDDSFRDSVNDATFYGRSAHYAKYMSVEVSDEIREGSYVYYRGTIRVALSRQPWYWTIDNVGYRYWTGANATGDLVEFKDDDGFPVSEPGKLATDGQKAANNAVINQIRYRPEALDYSGLGIGTAWP